ncbi:DUF418 domain-containing protein [Mesonia sp. MT50]|uniref:DUF418 domain-containing protein n=1 Tax=Mesonia profundi TaxID=3070998 RepID=A0ABU1A452_9FLAO|nr:DUF418 domain-containing protein [Mesonia profundi]MDQ7918483.1 DUF418 domain-containing protein [Mesonia profundi]
MPIGSFCHLECSRKIKQKRLDSARRDILYESLSPSETFITATFVFIGQVIFSKLWLTYFQFGPLEWIWRCFTYKELIPIRKKSF